MDAKEYSAFDATALAELIRSNQVQEEEVRDAALTAIAAVDARLNAVAHGPFEDAVAGPGPFAGVPFALKDTLMEAGRPFEFGSRLLAGVRAPADTVLAQRFRAAGLVSLVRTATPEFGFNLDTAPAHRGPTRNPWDLERSPGGSSGGAAALVAARALPMAHANDGGGSIRVPAARCGLVGLKPSRGRVSMGPFIGEPSGGIAHEFAVTRSVRDTAALLDAVAGPAPGDRYYVLNPGVPFATAMDEEPLPLRVALQTEAYFGRETQPEVRQAVEVTARVLEDLGHRVEPVAPPVNEEELRTLHLIVWSLLLSSMAGIFGTMVERTPGPDVVETASLACIAHGSGLAARDVVAAAAIQNGLARAWGAFLDDYDLYLCPTTPTTAQPVGVPDQNAPEHTTAEAWIDEVFSWVPFTPIANSTGQPAISLPLARDAQGLPIGVMLTAQTLREDLLLQVSGQLEQALPWANREPIL